MSSSLGSCGCAALLRCYIFCKLTKVTLSCAGREVVPNRTRLRITARSTHEENATAGSGAFSIGSTFFPQHIALALMQLISYAAPQFWNHTDCFVIRGLLSPGRKSSLHRFPQHGRKATGDESSNSYSGCGRNNRSRLLYPIIRVPVLPQWTSMFSCRRSL